MQEMSQTSYEILFQSDDLIVVKKPFGVLSVPARFKDDPRRCLGTELQASLGKQIFPVHRLDFEVEGPLIFALTSRGQREASTWFEKSMLQKKYLAFSEGPEISSSEILEWKSVLVKGKKRTFEAPYGKKSLTRARCLGSVQFQDHQLSKWELEPVTGRSHQLRFEMVKNCGPIWGDSLYGSKINLSPQRMALACIRIDLSKISKRLGLPEVFEHIPSFEKLTC